MLLTLPRRQLRRRGAMWMIHSTYSGYAEYGLEAARLPPAGAPAGCAHAGIFFQEGTRLRFLNMEKAQGG